MQWSSRSHKRMFHLQSVPCKKVANINNNVLLWYKKQEHFPRKAIQWHQRELYKHECVRANTCSHQDFPPHWNYQTWRKAPGKQYQSKTALQTTRFSSWHKGNLRSFALVFPLAEYPAFLLNICEDPCFYYFSSLMDSTLLSIREASKWQPQHGSARCPEALAHTVHMEVNWQHLKHGKTQL